jgi:MinD-like ATPase involved in chromosome partitioning or flagellar assembly
MMKIGLLGSEDTVARLVETSVLADVQCGDFNLEIEDVAGLVIEVEHLSLRIVASCDARSIPFVVLSSAAASGTLAAFGLEISLGSNASWDEILEALGLTRASPNAVTPTEQLEESEPTARVAQVIAVWGPAGAPGRSSIAINLASEAALLGRRVLLIDADTYGGSIAGYLELFDESPGFLAAGRLAAQENLNVAEIARLTHSFQVGSASIAVLSGIVSARRWPELSAMRVRACIHVLRAHFDVIICDVGFNLEQDEEISSDMTSPRRNQATLEILTSSDEVVAVASADVIGIARFIQSLESLRSCVGQARLVVVANRVRDSRAANASVVQHTLHRFAGLTEITVVNDDRQTFATAVDLAVPLCVSAPKSVVRGQIVKLTQGLMG